MNNVVTFEKLKEKELYLSISKYQEQIERLVGSFMPKEQFIQMASLMIKENSAISRCSAKSVIGALLNVASLQLKPNAVLGHCYLVPYGNEVSFILGYKGMIELMYRSENVKKVFANAVFVGDEFEYEYGFDEKLRHIPVNNERKFEDLLYTYCIVELQGGGKVFTVIPKEVYLKKRAASPSARAASSPHNKYPTGMAIKTAVRAIEKFVPMTEGVRKQITAEELITDIEDFTENGIKEDVFDNPEKNIELAEYTEVDNDNN